MFALDQKVAVHHLVAKSGACPIKQAQRPEFVLMIKTEVRKLIETGSISEVK